MFAIGAILFVIGLATLVGAKRTAWRTLGAILMAGGVAVLMLLAYNFNSLASHID
jgi:hypothetical protein